MQELSLEHDAMYYFLEDVSAEDTKKTDSLCPVSVYTKFTLDPMI